MEEIYQTMMLPLWEWTREDDRNRPLREKGITAMRAYREGTYSVFGRNQSIRSLPALDGGEPQPPVPEAQLSVGFYEQFCSKI